jgi:hypothetical protein
MSKAEGIKKVRIGLLMEEAGYRFIHFKGGDLMSGPGTHGFVAFNARLFKGLCEKHYPGMSNNMIRDFSETVRTLAPDWSPLDYLIGFGDKVWNTKTLEWTTDELQWVYSSPLTPSSSTALAERFLDQLAQGDSALSQDYLQSMAPLFMHRKPAGVIWFVGDGANGKSSLISALYRIMGGKHLASLTTAAIEDGKATPVLAGILGNIVREASETRIEDTERYKAIGTHEPFAVRQLYTQENITVETNFHSIFNANNVPVFSDKTKGARRRTLVIPFKAHFADNPLFDDETFTDEFLGGLLTLILRETLVIRDNGYRYKWSDATVQAKLAYDSEVNSAESFLEYLKEKHIVGFYNYAKLKWEYESFCALNGYLPLGLTTLKRTMMNDAGAVRRVFKEDGVTVARYLFGTGPVTWVEPYAVATPVEAVVEQQEISHEW